MTETLRRQRPNPCNGCPDRYPACSDHCTKPAYLAYREEQEKIRQARKAYYSGIWTNGETDPNNYRCGKKKK